MNIKKIEATVITPSPLLSLPLSDDVLVDHLLDHVFEVDVEGGDVWVPSVVPLQHDLL